MEIGERIKTHRTQLNLSQEALAEKVYVTRQTISNWENNKSYPDINSLLRLGEVFDITMDQLLKGDLEIMKEKINSTDIQKMKAMSIVYGGLLLLTVISLPILFHYMNWHALYIWLPILAITSLQATRIEQLKNEFDVQTYREIEAFMNGDRLDEIEKIRESGKRPYQSLMFFIVSGFFGFGIAYLIMMLLEVF